MSIDEWFHQHLAPLPSQPPLRPPGARPEDEFVDRCIKCGQCAQVCPYDSIEMTTLTWGRKAGTPVIFARAVPCWLCMECPPVCPSGALDDTVREKEQVRMGLAVVNEELCLPFLGVICRACFEKCPIYRKAIVLRDELYPQVDPEHCTGCGVCEHVCVAEVAAITVKSHHDV